MEKVCLIFGRSSKAVGLMIRFLDISQWSHVGIVDGDCVYESTGSRFKGKRARRKGVIKTKLDVFKARYSGWRMKEVWTSNINWRGQCELLVTEKSEYDLAATIGSIWIFRLLRIKLGSKHAHNCSEFVNVVLRRFLDDYSPTVADWWRLRE